MPESIGSLKKQESSGKTSICALLAITKPLMCGSQQTVENSERAGNTRPLNLPPEESVYRSRSNSWNWTWNNRLVTNWERSMSRLYVVNPLAVYIMQSARLDEVQAGIKTAGRNINNLRYADDTTLMGEREDKLTSLLMKVKEERETAGLKLNIQKIQIMPPVPSLHGK